MRAPQALIEKLAQPIMSYIVPRQKLGVFADLARMEMDRLGPNASQDDVRKVMQKAWASVDNRMGQLVYLLTGKWPGSLTDVFFPKTGEKDAYGHDVRISFPSYVKDEAAFYHAPLQTLENKANPLLSSLFQLWNNKDYYGTQIANPEDSWGRQALARVAFAGRQFAPFSITGGNKFAEASPPPKDSKGPVPKLLGPGATHTMLSGVKIPDSIPTWLGGGSHVLGAPTFGFTPSPSYLSTSPAEQRASEIEDRLHSGDIKTQQQAGYYQAMSALREQFAHACGEGPAVATRSVPSHLQNAFLRTRRMARRQTQCPPRPNHRH